MVSSLPACTEASCVDDMYGDDNVGVEEVKCRCLCVCVLSQMGADRPAGKQAARPLISSAGADAAAPAGASTAEAFSLCAAGSTALHLSSLHHLLSRCPSSTLSRALLHSLHTALPGVLGQTPRKQAHRGEGGEMCKGRKKTSG